VRGVPGVSVRVSEWSENLAMSGSEERLLNNKGKANMANKNDASVQLLQESDATAPLTRQLPVKLTEAEWVKRCEMLAGTIEERKSLLMERANLVAEIRRKLAENEVTIEDLSTAVHARAEVQTVVIEERKNFRSRKLETIRTDTGEVIEMRPLKPHELQGELPKVSR
jgi:hypothetical protein